MQTQEQQTEQQADAVAAIRAVAPQAVEALRLTYERFGVQLGKLAVIRNQVNALRKPYARQAKPFRKEAREYAAQLSELTAESPAETFRAVVLSIRASQARVAAIQAEAEKQLQPVLDPLMKQAEAVKERIQEIDDKLPGLLADALVQELIKQ